MSARCSKTVMTNLSSLPMSFLSVTMYLSSYRCIIIGIVTCQLQVFVKVIAVEPSTGKISLSIKYVNQTTGQDLDQNGVELDRENQKRKVPCSSHQGSIFKKFSLLGSTSTTGEVFCFGCDSKRHLYKMWRC
jgi:hypothetical protein